MLLNQFDCLLFDADDTLFIFDSRAGLGQLLAKYHVQMTEQDYQTYQVFNQALWGQYQQGEIDSQQLQQQRFAGWAKKLAVTTQQLNIEYQQTMAEICQLLPGVASLLQALQGKVRLGIITNGFTGLLKARLEKTGLTDYFDILTVSEQFGVAKPDVRIFNHTLSQLGGILPARTLMVGDNPESDILGGIKAGMLTCWLDHNQRALPAAIQPDWRVSGLFQLQKLLWSEGE